MITYLLFPGWYIIVAILSLNNVVTKNNYKLYCKILARWASKIYSSYNFFLHLQLCAEHWAGFRGALHPQEFHINLGLGNNWKQQAIKKLTNGFILHLPIYISQNYSYLCAIPVSTDTSLFLWHTSSNFCCPIVQYWRSIDCFTILSQSTNISWKYYY